MDVETSNAIESLRHDLERATTDLRTEMRQLGDEITGTLRSEMHEMRDELSRNAAILTESVRDDIRIVAEGLAAVSAKIDALRR